MALTRWLMSGLVAISLVATTGCWSTRGCCRKHHEPECCPAPCGAPAPAMGGAPVVPAPSGPTSYSIGPTCALPLQ